MHPLRPGVGDLGAVGESGGFYDLELAVLREDEEVGGGEEREAAEELWSDVHLDGGRAAHEAQVVEFDESFAEHVLGRRTSGGESDGGERSAVDVEVGQRPRMDFDGLLLTQSARIMHRDATRRVAGHQILLAAS